MAVYAITLPPSFWHPLPIDGYKSPASAAWLAYGGGCRRGGAGPAEPGASATGAISGAGAGGRHRVGTSGMASGTGPAALAD